MLAKKITASIAGLAAAAAMSAPAFADNGNHYGHYRHYGNHGYGKRVVVERVYVQPRPVVQHYYYRPDYRPAPRPVVVVEQPRPVYHYSHPDTGAAILVGAVLGAAIVHHAITGY